MRYGNLKNIDTVYSCDRIANIAANKCPHFLAVALGTSCIRVYCPFPYVARVKMWTWVRVTNVSHDENTAAHACGRLCFSECRPAETRESFIILYPCRAHWRTREKDERSGGTRETKNRRAQKRFPELGKTAGVRLPSSNLLCPRFTPRPSSTTAPYV